MNNYEYIDLFNENSVSHKIIIECEDGTVIDNTMLHSESIELNESLCSELDLTFGACESSSIQFVSSKILNSLKGQKIVVKEYMNGHDDNMFKYGKYKVDSDVYSDDHSKHTVKAYDKMYELLNADVTEWYRGLPDYMTQKAFRDSLFSFLGVEQVNTTLVNDDVLIRRTIVSDGLLAGSVLKAICEINGVFGHITRDDKFAYINLKNSQTVNVSTYIPPIEYEDYTKLSATGVTIRQNTDDVGGSVGTDENRYIVTGNFLCYGMSDAELRTVASNMFSVIKDIEYRPFDLQMRGNPCYEVGDKIHIDTAKGNTVDSFIMTRRLSGIQGKRDKINAYGDEYFANDGNNLNAEIQQIAQKTNELTRTVEGTVSRVTSIESDLTNNYLDKEQTESLIEQSADEITIKVEKEVEKNLSVGAKNLLNDSEFAFCLVRAEYKVSLTDENNEILSDELDNILYE